ncbi:hypothetical protein MASR2M64_12630 [Candidatus Cloacimonadota bacterium]|jgi:hypothetical protein|nr:hypothetical protein [Candidatus Cloacimonadota bacterium]MDD3234819.1 hypothetical protein [Candidatus Cloacimonadota bacterium]
MKKCLLLFAALGLSVCGLMAQAAQPGGFNSVQSYVEKEVLDINVKALIPASDEFREKSDTYQKAGEYNFTFNQESMRENSEILLNKWLKESK